MVGIDYQGVGIIITAVFAGIASIIAAFNGRTARSVKHSIETNGDPRTLGEIATDVAAQVAPAPTTPPVENPASGPGTN